MKDLRPKTIFLDIDGCLFKHPNHPNAHTIFPPEILPNVKEKLNEWIMKDYKIILTTGRKECAREETEKQLRHHGITWDQLIMNLGGGKRILINDTKPNIKESTALAFCVERNVGLNNVNI